MKLDALKSKLLADPETRRAYEEQAPEFDIARELIAARTRAGLTQADVAAKMGTTQSAVARMEGGHLPSLRSLLRYAEATGARLDIHLKPAAAG